MAARYERRDPEETCLVSVRGLSQCYTRRLGLTRRRVHVQALNQVDMTISRGSIVALVGESGSGKSTLARCLAGLEKPTSGEVELAGRSLFPTSRIEQLAVRRRVQLIFQDPVSALNPRLTAAEIVEEPLLVHGEGNRAERRERALQGMEKVGLSRELVSRLPLDLSGGQRQRLAIARALVLQPEFLILDEALSNLDLSIQAQLINLLLELHASHVLTYLFITHDLTLAGHFADEVAVLHQGRIVEHAAASALFTNPQHPETRLLLAPIPVRETVLFPRP